LGVLSKYYLSGESKGKAKAGKEGYEGEGYHTIPARRGRKKWEGRKVEPVAVSAGKPAEPGVKKRSTPSR